MPTTFGSGRPYIFRIDNKCYIVKEGKRIMRIPDRLGVFIIKRQLRKRLGR